MIKLASLLHLLPVLKTEVKPENVTATMGPGSNDIKEAKDITRISSQLLRIVLYSVQKYCKKNASAI